MQRHVRSLLTPDLSQKKDMSRMLPPMISFTCSTSQGKPDEKDVVETFLERKEVEYVVFEREARDFKTTSNTVSPLVSLTLNHEYCLSLFTSNR